MYGAVICCEHHPEHRKKNTNTAWHDFMSTHGGKPLQCLGAARRQSHLKELCVEASRIYNAAQRSCLEIMVPLTSAKSLDTGNKQVSMEAVAVAID
jgi:hypothetical protein